MTYIPKPPKRIKNKGKKEWEEFRNNYFLLLWAAEDTPKYRTADGNEYMEAVCSECGGRRTVYKIGVKFKTELHLHHEKKRLSYPELKYNDRNLQLLCPNCHRRKHE